MIMMYLYICYVSGGFSKTQYSETEFYPSELADDGKVTWSKFNALSDGSVGPMHIKNIRQ